MLWVINHFHFLENKSEGGRENVILKDILKYIFHIRKLSHGPVAKVTLIFTGDFHNWDFPKNTEPKGATSLQNNVHKILLCFPVMQLSLCRKTIIV